MIYLISDTHSNKIELKATKDDVLIHLGDWEQGEVNTEAFKILVSGNHDMFPTDKWDFVCDGFLKDHIWYTHEPAERLPKGAYWNIHGHVHYHNMNDCGYEKKWFHLNIEPNTIFNLDRFMFEEKDKRRQEMKWE
jgi:predicted phosphodiesterase